MPSLYNCKHSGDRYRITKFTSDFEVEASYICDLHSCECLAGHRPTCRHRQMLPKFIARDAVGTSWFFDFDRGGWVQGWKEEPAAQPLQGQPQPELTIAREITLPADASPEEVAEAFSNLLASAALPIQPEPEPSPPFQLGGFPDRCLSSGECTTSDDCILNGCAHGHGTPAREPSSLRFNKDYSNSIGQSPAADALGPSPSPTIRRRV